jgi:hypothetical protein
VINPVVLLVYTLAAARVTGLITLDTITEQARDGFVAWLDDRPATLGKYVAGLVTCPWCMGVWVSAVVAPVAWWWGDHPVVLVPAIALAMAQVIGMISDLGR